MRVTCIRFIQHEWPMPIGHWIRSESFAARAAVQRPLAAASASTAAAARTERPTERAAGRAVLTASAAAAAWVYAASAAGARGAEGRLA